MKKSHLPRPKLRSHKPPAGIKRAHLAHTAFGGGHKQAFSDPSALAAPDQAFSAMGAGGPPSGAMSPPPPDAPPPGAADGPPDPGAMMAAAMPPGS